MLTFRKIIIYQPWLLPVVVFALLVQVQQAVACDMMIDTSGPAEVRCYNHVTEEKNQSSKTGQPCCDYSTVDTIKSGYCNDGNYTTINNQLLGKLNPDFSPTLILVIPQYINPSLALTALHIFPDRESSQPGTRTYLSTLRLRI